LETEELPLESLLDNDHDSAMDEDLDFESEHVLVSDLLFIDFPPSTGKLLKNLDQDSFEHSSRPTVLIAWFI